MILKDFRKQITFKTFTLTTVLLLLGCSIQPPDYYTNEDAAYQSIECSHDNFKKMTTCISPYILNSKYETRADGSKELYTEGGGLYVYYPKMLFRMVKIDNNKEIAIQLYFSVVNPDWAFYENAYDENGKSLSLTKIDQKIDTGYSYHSTIVNCKEEFALNINKAYLEQYKNTELRIKVEGKRKSFIFAIQPEFIRGILKHLNQQEYL